MVMLPSRQFARFVGIAALTCAAAAFLMNTASASEKVMSGTHSFGQVAAACGSSGGQFTVSASGGYGCIGEKTGVACNAKGQCTAICYSGKCPAIAKGLNGALRPPASAGTASAASGTATKNKLPLHNVNQPVVVQRSGGARSGGSKH
jgi:apolipoprotein N-acyltransferase